MEVTGEPLTVKIEGRLKPTLVTVPLVAGATACQLVDAEFQLSKNPLPAEFVSAATEEAKDFPATLVSE